MKSIVCLLAALFASAAFADEPQCVQADEGICTIDSFCWQTTPPQTGGWAFYKLSTSLQLVNKINVDANVSGVCQVSKKLGPPALAKLKAQAQQLKDAGICKVIINNVD